jgi:hypothetical protein
MFPMYTYCEECHTKAGCDPISSFVCKSGLSLLLPLQRTNMGKETYLVRKISLSLVIVTAQLNLNLCLE